MKKLLIVTLALALGLVASGTATATPADVTLPEPTAEPEVTETDVADADAQRDTEQEPEDSTAELGDGTYGIPDPEAGLRQNVGCFYTCTHPIMCPNIINLPRPSCVNGCCVY